MPLHLEQRIDLCPHRRGQFRFESIHNGIDNHLSSGGRDTSLLDNEAYKFVRMPSISDYRLNGNIC